VVKVEPGKAATGSAVPLRVLIVEDSEDDALLLVRELRRGGYEPVHERVETPEVMRDALRRSAWDLILSDYRLPRFDAPAALALAREEGSGAPVVVISGRIGEEEAVGAMKAGAHDYVMKGNLARLCATVGRGLDEAREHERAREELRRRDGILDAVRFAAERLLGQAYGWEESVDAVLRRLGEAADVSRVYLFENFTGEDGGLWNLERNKWVAPGISPGLAGNSGGDAVRRFPYRDDGSGRWSDFRRWEEVLGHGEPMYGNTRDFPETERTFLAGELGILSMVLVPIFVEGRWWGFIGFDECQEEREWSLAEIGALGAAAGTLGSAIRRRQVEEQLRASEERYRAVIEQATDGIFLLDAESRRVVESNPAFQRMFGYSAEELRETEIYDLVAHPRWNVDATIERTLGERRRIVGERRYRRKDGSLLDVEVGVSVISLSGREVICTIVRDVTGRKRAEEALTRSENRLRTIIETEPECVKVLGADGVLLEMNPAGLSMIEADSLEQVRGRSVYDYIAPDHRRAFADLTEDVLHGGSGTLEFELIGLKGTRRWLETHAVPLREVGVEGFGLLAITRDTTQRKWAEEELRSSEERFKGLAEATFEGVAITREGRIVETNAAFASMFGYEPSEVIGMSPLDFATPESREIVRTVRGDGLEEPYEAVCVRKDGTSFDTEIRGRMSRYKGHVVRVTAFRDITERKRSEEALRQSEWLYRTVIEQATENIFLVDVETRRIVESNPAFREALGYTAEELERMTLYDVVVHDRESVDENIRRVAEGMGPSVGERKYLRKDGSLLDMEVSASLILRDGRETICAVAHDVTERARMQRSLEERIASLSRISAGMTLDLPGEDTLNALAESAVNASTAVACGVVLVGEDDRNVDLFGSNGLPEGYTAGLQRAYRDGVRSPSLEAFHARRPVLVGDFRRVLLEDPLYEPVHHFAREVPWDIVYSLPLVSRGRALGAIFFCFLPDQEPGEDEQVFLRAVADQAAVVVENAGLFAEAREKAALEERQRLARELHDSVSQALYGIALGTRTAQKMAERNPERVGEPLEYVLSLAEAGLAEMRALIFELRPESLETEGLVAALEKHAAALDARHGIEVDDDLREEPEVSLQAKEALYRIAQEALHNTVKHARARKVGIALTCEYGHVSVEISDDGVGFDAGEDFPGHLGLRSMRERVSRLGGTLEVRSGPGEGTTIRASLPSDA
jgi:PAS domain S-box-containing protein